MKELGSLGKIYLDGELIVKYGDPVDDFYVIQEGKVEMVGDADGQEVKLITCGQGEIIGEWAIEPGAWRSAQLRAVGRARVLTIHRKLLMQRMHEDPSLAFRILETMSRRLQQMTERILDKSQA